MNGKCQACDAYADVNDIMLCDGCDEKIERDLIRKREYDHAALTAFQNADQREIIRKEIIKKYGKKHELIK